MGGEALLEAMHYNFNIKVLCVTDNKVGPDIATQLAGRLRGYNNNYYYYYYDYYYYCLLLLLFISYYYHYYFYY